MPLVSQRRDGSRPARLLIGTLGFLAAVALVMPVVVAQEVPGGDPAAPPAATTKPTTKPNPTKPTVGKPAAAKNVAAPVAPAASPYEALPVDLEQRKKQSEIGKMLRAGRFEAGQQEVFDAFYLTYFLAQWTLVENYTNLPELRKDLGNHFKMAKSGPVHDHLATLALQFLTSQADDPKRHPAVRYNAMLMIGDLNQAESLRGSEPPVPLPTALPVLLKALQNDQQIEAVKVAALRGMLRHAILGIANPQVRDATVIPALLQVATTQAMADPQADGQNWMRVLAIDALGALGSMGNQGAVVKALVSVAGEADGPLMVRCTAARALGALDYQPGAAPLNTLQLASVIRELTLEACTKVLDRQKEEAQPLRRRELKDYLHCIRIGLEGTNEQRKGIAGLASTEAQRALVNGTLQQVQSLLDLLDNKDLEDETLVERLTELLTKYRQAAEPAPAPKPAAGAAKPETAPAKP